MILLALAACRPDYAVADPCGLGANTLRLEEADFLRAGSARDDEVLDEIVTLTPLEDDRAGSAFHVEHRLSSRELEVAFDFRIGGGGGADGFAFLVVDPDRAPERYLGTDGACLGFATTPHVDGDCACGAGLPGWAVTFDTWWNECFDPVDLGRLPLTPHGALVVDGVVETPLATWSIAPLERDRFHTAELVMSGGALTVTLDGAVAFSGLADVPDFLGYVGFTASTGDEHDRHEVRGLALRPGTCVAGPDGG